MIHFEARARRESACAQRKVYNLLKFLSERDINKRKIRSLKKLDKS